MSRRRTRASDSLEQTAHPAPSPPTPSGLRRSAVLHQTDAQAAHAGEKDLEAGKNGHVDLRRDIESGVVQSTSSTAVPSTALPPGGSGPMAPPISGRPSSAIQLEAAKGRTLLDRLRSRFAPPFSMDVGPLPLHVLQLLKGNVVRLCISHLEPIPARGALGMASSDMFVKVHVCDLAENGLWMHKGHANAVPVVPYTDKPGGAIPSSNIVDQDDVPPDFPRDFPGTPALQKECGFVRPLETAQGVRAHVQRVEFNSRWTFTLDASVLLRPGSIFFFELLQRCPLGIGSSTQACYYRVGWSFFRPDFALRRGGADATLNAHSRVSKKMTSTGVKKQKLQLYSYVRRLHSKVRAQTCGAWYEADATTMHAQYVKDSEMHEHGPNVFYEFAWPYRSKQESYLSISIELVDAAVAHNIAGINDNSSLRNDQAPETKALQENKLAHCVIQKRDMTSNWPIPEELMHIFPTTGHGCFRMCLSTSGEFLVAACDSPSSMYELRAYDLNVGNLHCVFEGHSALVYDIFWHSHEMEEVVVSCSGDGRVLLFTVPSIPTDVPISPHVSLYHPSHVYSCRAHPMSASASHLVMACGGFGFGFRLWQIERRAESGHLREVASKAVADVQTEDKSDVYCLRFSRGENLITAHADGYLVLWRITVGATLMEGLNWQQLRVYRNPDFAGVPIYHFDIITSELLLQRPSTAMMQVADDWILLHAKDNLVRICALQQSVCCVTNEFPVKNSRFGCRGMISPSGEHVILGCETGKVFIFSIDGKAVDWVPIRLGSPVCDIVWSRRHHLIGVCAYEADEPPIVVFYYPRDATQSAPAFRPPDRSSIGDMRASLTGNVDLLGRVSASAETWAMNWMNLEGSAGGGPLGLNRKREIKASILGEALDRKSHAALEASISTRVT